MTYYTFLFLLTLSISNISAFPYTLPTDSTWPPNSEFLKLREVINGKVIIKGDKDYNPHTWNKITNVPKPAVIIQPINSNDVIESLKFAKKYNIRLSVQSTGHHQDHRNIYDNSVHIDMSSMNAKTIDLTKKTLTLGTGNNFSVIQEYVGTQSNYQLVALCGADKGVGIYGWTTGGGHGALTRIYGLGVDALLSIDLVLSNFTIITASETQNHDLFRAIRGSGGSAYGIAVSLTIRLYDDPGMSSKFSGLYEFKQSTSDMFSNWLISAPNFAGAYFLPYNVDKKYIVIFAHCFSNGTTCESVFQPLYNECLPGNTCGIEKDKNKNFYEFIKNSDSDLGGVIYLASTAFNPTNIVNALRETTDYIFNNQYTGCSANSILGGQSSTLDVNQTSTSVSKEMRTSIMAITCFSIMEQSNDVPFKKYQVEIMDKLSENVFKKYSKWVYWNEPQHNFPSNDWKERYWGNLDNYNKLLAVKNKYDPDNFFSCYHCVGYEMKNEDPAVCPAVSCTCSNTPNGVCNKSFNLKYDNIIVIGLLFIVFLF